MSQLAQNGDVGLVQDLGGLSVPLTGSGAPTTQTTTNPFQYYVNTASPNHVYQNNTGTTWADLGASPTQANRYLALLSADPVLGQAVNISDAGFVELTTSNCPAYARQSVAFGNLTSAYPSFISNTAAVTWTNVGPMTTSCQWVALVTVSSGTTGWFLASWALVSPIQLTTTESIQLGVGQLVLQGN